VCVFLLANMKLIDVSVAYFLASDQLVLFNAIILLLIRCSYWVGSGIGNSVVGSTPVSFP